MGKRITLSRNGYSNLQFGPSTPRAMDSRGKTPRFPSPLCAKTKLTDPLGSAVDPRTTPAYDRRDFAPQPQLNPMSSSWKQSFTINRLVPARRRQWTPAVKRRDFHHRFALKPNRPTHWFQRTTRGRLPRYTPRFRAPVESKTSASSLEAQYVL